MWRSFPDSEKTSIRAAIPARFNLVMVADGGELNPSHFLNSRIRVTGVGRTVLTLAEIRCWRIICGHNAGDGDFNGNGRDGCPAGATPTLVTVEQIQGLSKEEAARHMLFGFTLSSQALLLPCSSTCPFKMKLVASLSASFVSRHASCRGTTLRRIGHTATGDFAPLSSPNICWFWKRADASAGSSNLEATHQW